MVTAPAWRVFYLVSQSSLGFLTVATPLFPRWLLMFQEHTMVVKLYTSVRSSLVAPC